MSKYDFFPASVWSIQIKAIVVLWYTVSFKSMVFNGSNILSLTYNVKIDHLACRVYFHNSDHVGSQENLSFVFLLVNRHANAGG